jgi:hypothetical protein
MPSSKSTTMKMKLPAVPESALDNVRLRFVSTIPTAKKSIFYSLKPEPNEATGLYEAYYRTRFDSMSIGKCHIAPRFWRIVFDEGHVASGDDPRFVSHGENSFVQDNTWGNSRLLDVDDHYKAYRLPSDGKNLTIVPAGNPLYCLEWMKPLRVMMLPDPITKGYDGAWVRKISRSDGVDLSFRGGTPGYETTEKGIFLGMGHKTSEIRGRVVHRSFFWRLDTRRWKLTTHDLDVDGLFTNAIVDPTSVLQYDGRFYVITAESQNPWFTEMQDYVTNIYEIHFA